MTIGGFQKFSLIDYPGLVSAVIFTRGCNLRCPYCHNPELVLPEKFESPVDTEYIINFLENRKGKIDSVTITGGEPLLQKGLIPFIYRIKKLKFKIKLDTNGTFPEIVEKILNENLVDFIAMDIKAPYSSYSKIAGVSIDTNAITKSILSILNSGIDYQFRTTIVPGLHTEDMVEEISCWMHNLGAVHIFQDFVPARVLDAESLKTPGKT